MNRTTRLILCAGAILAALLTFGATGAAAITYQFGVNLDPGGVYAPAGTGEAGVNLDTSKDSKFVISPPAGADRYSSILASGNDYRNSSTVAGLAVGDVLKIFQPSGSVTPAATFTVPSVSLNVVTGGGAITGELPAGFSGAVSSEFRCGLNPQFKDVGAGAFSLAVATPLPGTMANVAMADANGNFVGYTQKSAGETPCIYLDASDASIKIPGEAVSPKPFNFFLGSIYDSVATSVRVVLRRGAAAYSDSFQNSSSFGDNFAMQPQAGDVIDIYRPRTAGSPSSSYTVPTVTAVFDPTVDKVAVDAPASSQLYVRDDRALINFGAHERYANSTGPGRTIVDFGAPQGALLSTDMRADDRVTVAYRDLEGRIQYTVRASVGDLAPPNVTLKISKNIKLSALVKAFKKGLKVRLSSNEAASSNLSLRLGKVKLASAKSQVRTGSNVIKLKFTKAGKKAIAKLVAKGHKFKSASAKLTAVTTDVSGNASTVVKKTKIKA